MSQIDRIETFVRLIEEKQFTRVAKKLGITTAAISKQISTLESEIGLKLIERTTRRVLPTEAGMAFFNQCQHLLEELQQTYSFAAQLRKEPVGTLRVTSNRYFGEKYILPYLKDFLNLYPKIILDLELSERFPDMKREKIDLIFGVSVIGPDDAIQKKISTTRYVLVASPAYLKQEGAPKRPGDLSQFNYITHSMRERGDVIPFKNNQEIHVVPSLYLNDTKAMLMCAINGLGIVRLHDYVVAESLASGDLVEILGDYGLKEQPIYLYYKADRFLRPKIRCFIEFFSDKIKGLS